MEADPEGGYRVVRLQLSAPGTWRLQIDALITDFERIRFETEVEVRR
jgi:hypothetical protein